MMDKQLDVERVELVIDKSVAKKVNSNARLLQRFKDLLDIGVGNDDADNLAENQDQIPAP